MTQGFAQAFAFTMQHEGGYTDDGPTYMGIDRQHWPLWEGWPVVDACRRAGRALSLEPGLAEMVRRFYLVHFWQGPARCHLVERKSVICAMELFDSAVNCGPANGVRFLQRGLNALKGRGTLYPQLVDDGVFGSRTLEALRICIQRRGDYLLYRCQNGEQYIHYKSLSRHQDYPGWFRRT